ncbi:MAG: transporter [Hymenobacter sp.]
MPGAGGGAAPLAAAAGRRGGGAQSAAGGSAAARAGFSAPGRGPARPAPAAAHADAVAGVWGGVGVFCGVGRRLGLARGTVGALILTGGISSVSFVGFPIFELLYGPAGLAMGLVMSLAGSMLVGVTLGVVVGTWYGSAAPSWRAVPGQMLRFPPFLGFVAALAAHAVGYRHPALVRGVLERLSAPFPVIALLTVGLQLQLAVPQARARLLALGLAYKLLLAPLVVAVVYVGLARQHGPAVNVCLLGAAIGPMNTAAILAERYNLDPPLAAQMVGLGIPLSYPCWRCWPGGFLE